MQEVQESLPERYVNIRRKRRVLSSLRQSLCKSRYAFKLSPTTVFVLISIPGNRSQRSKANAKGRGRRCADRRTVRVHQYYCTPFYVLTDRRIPACSRTRERSKNQSGPYSNRISLIGLDSDSDQRLRCVLGASCTLACIYAPT
jgi:hypothetical protein